MKSGHWLAWHPGYNHTEYVKLDKLSECKAFLDTFYCSLHVKFYTMEIGCADKS